MILIDNNLSPRLVSMLEKKFAKMVHVREVALASADDIVVWDYAAKNKLHLLTKDTDFNNIQAIRGFPPKIIWLRCGNASTQEVITLIDKNYDDILSFLRNNKQGILEIR